MSIKERLRRCCSLPVRSKGALIYHATLKHEQAFEVAATLTRSGAS